MNGGAAPISFGSTRRSTWDCDCGKWGSIMCTRISPGWLRAIVTETDYAAQFLRERFPSCAGRVHRIYNGLDLAEFGRADFSSTPPLIIAVGRLIPKKGFGDLIRTCALFVKRGKSFRCEIIGEGPLENQLRGQID